MARLPFIFEEQILKITPEMVRERLKKQIFHVAKSKFLHKKSLDDLVNEKIKELNNYYDNEAWFFNEIQRQKYCNMYYVPYEDNPTAKYVAIEGKGTEQFEITGKPEFRMYGEEEKKTFIPLRKEQEEFRLILYNHPQKEIPSFTGKVSIDYQFSTHFSIANKNYGIKPTKDLLKIRDFFSDTDYFLMLNDKLYYRNQDITHDEITAATGNWAWREHTKRFEMNGKVYVNDEFLYQGSMECEKACFPFFLRRDERRNREGRAVQKVPIGGLNIPVLV